MWKQTNQVKEGDGKIWSVAFNFVSPQHHDIFASVGGNKASIYRCEADGAISLVQVYVDENREEDFFACKWTVDEASGAVLLLAAGLNAVLRVIDVSHETLQWTAQGHGDPINDIAVHPLRPSIVVTASRDQALRVWNIQTKVCVAILHAEGGHRNEILSVDFHPTDVNRFVSAGMDNAVKVWSLTDTNTAKAKLAASMTWVSGPTAFKPAHISSPVFSSRKVHAGYIDCVRWMGDFVVSKSVDNRILVWKPPGSGPEDARMRADGHIHFIQELALEDADIWFIRFSMDARCRVLACGSRTGRVFLWDTDAVTPHAKFRVKRPPGKDNTVRQTALSHDGSILLFSCDDGTIWRFDRNGGD